MVPFGDLTINEVLEFICLEVGNKSFLIFDFYFVVQLYISWCPALLPLFALLDVSPLTMDYQVKAWGQSSMCYLSKQ